MKNTKIIALGNRLMQDDAIGIKVIENIKNKLLKLGLTVIVAEADVDYCLHFIKNNDSIIIIDSTYFNLTPGTITITKLNENTCLKYRHLSMHQYNLLSSLNFYNKKINGILIGIEINTIDYSINLSPYLQKNFCTICNKVYSAIFNLLKQ